MGDVIKLRPRGCYTLADLPQREDIRKLAKSTGWEKLDELWRLYPGQFVMVTGIAGHGKSTFVLNVVANMAHDFGVRTFLFVPENEQSIRDKMRLIWGEREGFKYFCENQCIVQSAVEDSFGDDPMDLRSVMERAAQVIERDSVDVVVIDPWNELEHLKPQNQLMTDYIRDALMWLKRICRHYAVTVILIAHPTKAVTENGGRQPTLADIEGSMNWYNKCDNGLIVTRNFSANYAKVVSAKVREHGAGRIGECHFEVNPNTGRFTPQPGGLSL